MRYIIKTNNPDGIPSRWEISDFEAKYDVSVNSISRLYVTFKQGKRRRIKRLRLNVNSYPCEYCGSHTYIDGKVGQVEFSKESY